MIHKLRYDCIFCRKPGEVEYNDANPLSEERVAFWLKHVACDPCAAYHRTSRDMSHALFDVCTKWQAAKGSANDIPENREKVRRRLSNILTKLANAVEKFKHAPNKYDMTDVEMLIDFPDRAGSVIRGLKA